MNPLVEATESRRILISQVDSFWLVVKAVLVPFAIEAFPSASLNQAEVGRSVPSWMLCLMSSAPIYMKRICPNAELLSNVGCEVN